eukprot:5137418-Amphidinium_carterae.1
MPHENFSQGAKQPNSCSSRCLSFAMQMHAITPHRPKQQRWAGRWRSLACRDARWLSTIRFVTLRMHCAVGCSVCYSGTSKFLAARHITQGRLDKRRGKSNADCALVPI